MTRSLSYSRPKPSGGIALWSWIFMRISGVVLLGLALGHLVIMHLIHNVDSIDYNFVAGRYANWLWRGYDLAMIVLAMLHGISGVKILIDDYVHTAARNRLATGLLYAVGGGFLLAGSCVILFFKPMTPSLLR